MTKFLIFIQLFFFSIYFPAERLTSAVITELLERNSQMRSCEYRLRLEEEDRALQEKLLKTHFEKSQLYRKEVIYGTLSSYLFFNSQSFIKILAE